MKRLFAAIKIEPGDEFMSVYRNLKHDLRYEKIKWVEDQNIHITLKFFGETEESKIDAIGAVIQKRATATPEFHLLLKSLGIFGSSYAPKVVWTGIQPHDLMVSLMKNLHHDLQAAGYDPDRQNLVPHLTLGRIKLLNDKVIFQRTIERYKGLASSQMPVKELILFESILHREGPEYRALGQFPLKKELP